MEYQREAILMTLSHLQGHALLQAFQMWYFSYSCVSVDKISTDGAVVQSLCGSGASCSLSMDDSVYQSSWNLPRFTLAHQIRRSV